jgi:hypothetical protein
VNQAPLTLGVEAAPEQLAKPLWRTWHCVAIGLSFANLAAFQRWKPMLGYSNSDTYFMKLPPAPAEYWAAIVSVLLLGGIFSLITIFVSRIQTGRLLRIARSVWLLLLLKIKGPAGSDLRRISVAAAQHRRRTARSGLRAMAGENFSVGHVWAAHLLSLRSGYYGRSLLACHPV